MTHCTTETAEMVLHAARTRKRSRRVETFTELVATVALVACIAAILTVFTMQSAGAATLESLTFSENGRITLVVALAFIMAVMGGLTAAMIRKTVGVPKRKRRHF
jgi:hypothetical protein